jgi:hypothetical protein
MSVPRLLPPAALACWVSFAFASLAFVAVAAAADEPSAFAAAVAAAIDVVVSGATWLVFPASADAAAFLPWSPQTHLLSLFLPPLQLSQFLPPMSLGVLCLLP